MSNNIEMTFILKSNEIKEVGFGGAAILNTFSFWLMKNKANKKHLHDGYYWTYNSKRALSEIFYFWSERQVRNQIDKLVEKGYIIIGNYNTANYDRTSWYALTKKAWDLLKLEDINEYNTETVENTDLTKMSEEKESLRQKCQNHLTKMSDGCDKKVKAIPSINTSIDSSIDKENIKESERDFDYDEVVKKIINIFPGTKTKSVRDKKLPKILKKYGVEEVIKATTRYAIEVKGRDKNYIMQESTFWNTRYIDYLTENYEEESQQPTTPKRTYTTNVPNKAKEYDSSATNPKGHDNFELSDGAKSIVDDPEKAKSLEWQLLGW